MFIFGLDKFDNIKHLVIDEMQDYTPVQLAVLNMMYPCQKTILGDFGQVLNPCHLHTLDEIRMIYKDAEFVALNKSYRSTYEIMDFAKKSVISHSLKWWNDMGNSRNPYIVKIWMVRLFLWQLS